MVYLNYHFFPFIRIFYHLRHFKNDIRVSRIRDVHFRKAEWEDFEPANTISTFYCLYRVFFIIVFIFMLCFSMSCSGISKYGLTYYFIYFTHWTLIVGVVYATSFGIYVLTFKVFHLWHKAAVGVVGNTDVDVTEISSAVGVNESHVYNSVTDEEASAHALGLPFVPNSLNCLEEMIWILQTTTFTCSCVSVIGYWGFLFDAEEASEKSCTLAGQFFVHGINALMLVADLLITAIPVHITHVLYATAYGAVYVLFTGLYHVIPMNKKYPSNENGGHPFIYNFVNWTQFPVAVAFVLPTVGFVLITFLHLISLLLYSIRLHVVYNFFKPSVYKEHLYDYTNGGQKPKSTNEKNNEDTLQVTIDSEEMNNFDDDKAKFAPEEVVTETPPEISIIPIY